MKQQVVKGVAMTPAEWDNLRAVAQKRGRQSLSSIIRMAVAKFLEIESTETNGAPLSDQTGAAHS